MPTPPPVPPPGSLRLKFANALVNANVFLYRRSGGRMGARVKGAPVLLLDHVGRKSGRARTSPVLYLGDGPVFVVVPPRGGSDAMPVWWLNLKANADTSVQIGTQRHTVVARHTTAE